LTTPISGLALLHGRIRLTADPAVEVIHEYHTECLLGVLTTASTLVVSRSSNSTTVLVAQFHEVFRHTLCTAQDLPMSLLEIREFHLVRVLQPQRFQNLRDIDQRLYLQSARAQVRTAAATATAAATVDTAMDSWVWRAGVGRDHTASSISPPGVRHDPALLPRIPL
jgi:hypothetical protein